MQVAVETDPSDLISDLIIYSSNTFFSTSNTLNYFFNVVFLFHSLCGGRRFFQYNEDDFRFRLILSCQLENLPRSFHCIIHFELQYFQIKNPLNKIV